MIGDSEKTAEALRLLFSEIRQYNKNRFIGLGES